MAAKKSLAQVLHHKIKQREIGHIIEPLFCQQTKCYLVTNQVKNQVCMEPIKSPFFATLVHEVPTRHF